MEGFEPVLRRLPASQNGQILRAEHSPFAIDHFQVPCQSHWGSLFLDRWRGRQRLRFFGSFVSKGGWSSTRNQPSIKNPFDDGGSVLMVKRSISARWFVFFLGCSDKHTKRTLQAIRFSSVTGATAQCLGLIHHPNSSDYQGVHGSQ